MMRALPLSVGLLVAALAAPAGAQAAANLMPDPSIEAVQQENQFGVPFAMWGGWIFEGSPGFRNGKVARTGSTCAEIIGAQGGKIRLYSPTITVEPGRYRFACYIRGLDIGVHTWGLSEDFSFADDQYYPLKKTGTFGWTRLEIVKDVPAKQEIVARIGLWAPGRLWVDDAELVRVGDDVPLTEAPVLGEEEKPIAPPGELDAATAVRCPDCGYRNMLAWGTCYVCGEDLTAATQVAEGPPVKPLASFEDGTVAPFTPGASAAVEEHATDGRYAMRLDRDYISWDGPQDWTGYDFLKADVFCAGDAPADLYVEVRDKGTTDYWTRVNYNTVVPPGPSTLIVPTDLYVGEKSRPGRPLDKAGVVRFVFGIGEAKAPVFFDDIRLERDLSDSVKVPGLQAFSFGPGTSPPMRGFTQVTPATIYSSGRGYGLKDAQIWRAFDVLQPDPLYQTFICIEAGGFAIDLPNGTYHVFVNIDNPSGFWGEYQVYRERVIKANDTEVVHETQDLQGFLQRYFRFADVEDRPDENTFDKYQRGYFDEKEFDVDVTDGQLFLEFLGQDWANSVSALIVYPAEQADAGQQYLANLRERRRFYFDNYFKRILPDPLRDAQGVVPEFAPTVDEQAKGYALFSRDWMRDVSVNAVPRRTEVTSQLSVFASAGELEPVVFSLYPLRDVGAVTVEPSGLTGPGDVRLPADALRPGVVSHRLSRVTMEGSVYTIAPRFVMPRNSAMLQKGTTTTFWLTLALPRTVEPGEYKGTLKLTFADGATDTIDLAVRAFATPLDELDVPAGPWGSSIGLPWYSEDLGDYDQAMFRKCLRKLREYGCTTFSGIPTLRLRGWPDGRPDIDFARADWEMAEAKAAGFTSVVVNYNGGIQGFDNYSIDEGARASSGLPDYVSFLRAILTAVDAHAREAGWLPVAYNLCDEPIGDAVARATANAQAWREAAPPTLLTTGATSVDAPQPDDPHVQLAAALRIADLNLHSEEAIRLIHDAGSDWAFYNGGNRWTFGTYMYKCAHEFGMRFRLSWHWNNCAGDPYYALDCREDDYAWCVTDADMDLIPTIHFEREIREGIDDYRYMLTLARLAGEKPGHPAAAAGRQLLSDKLASFRLGEREHDSKWPAAEFAEFRLAVAEAIERLSE